MSNTDNKKNVVKGSGGTFNIDELKQNKDIKYTINLYFYSFTDDIIISNNSDIIFENNNLKIITKDESKMLEYEIDKLIKSMDNLSKYILENFKKDSSLKNLDLINNILFSLISLFSIK